MIKGFKKYFIIIIFIFVLTLIIGNFEVKASSQVWVNYAYSDTDLYDLTNTYNYDKITIEESYTKENGELATRDYNSQYFNMSQKNNEVVTTSQPILTVLTPGLGSTALDWSSSDDQFTYCEDSLVTRLSQLNDNGANIYWFLVKGNELKIYDLGKQNEKIKKGEQETYIESESEKISKITDISKPIIILFETSKSSGYNNAVYEDFNYAISKAVYDIKFLSNGVLPKINLIGHSRGGITNLQYALDHPDLVESIFSMGTPYLGSTSAMVDYGILESLGENIGGGPGTGEEDIVNPNRYMEYYRRWNNNYDSLYKDIEVNAYGGYSTTMFLQHIFTSNYATDNLSAVEIAGIIALIELIEDTEFIYNSGKLFLSSNWLTRSILKISEDLIELLGSSSSPAALADIITNEIKFDWSYPFTSWYNDGLVDLDSQLGQINLNNDLADLEYKGFNREKIRFTISNSKINNVAHADFSVVHNLETRDDKIIKKIVQKISISGKTIADYETYKVSDTEIGIKTILKSTSEETLIIPSSINGKTVVEIADSAFSNDFNGNYSIKSVVIPSSIKRIGKNAFEDCIYLENVSFASDSQLEQVGDYAFFNCLVLNTVLMPSTVTSLGDFVFLNCEKLTQYSYNNYMFYNLESLNCRSTPYSNSHYLDKGYSMYLSFELECPSRYDFNVESEEQINILLYDENMNIIFDQPVSINGGTDESIIRDLEAGMYFLRVDFVDSENQGNLEVTLRSRDNNVDEVLVDEPKDVLTHLHDNHNEFSFMKNTNGFYKINLNGESVDPLIYSSGTITVFDANDNIIEKFDILENEYINLADSIYNSNNMIIYVQAYKTYTIHVDLINTNLTNLEILVTSLDDEKLNTTGGYCDIANVIVGDNISKLNINQTGEFNLQVEYYDISDEEIYFVLIKENLNGIEVLTSYILNNNNYIDQNYLFNENDVLYIGYYNGTGVGTISINMTRFTDDTFTIITDPNSNVTVGSEVYLNSGSYGGVTITQGFTRICYLGNDAPYLQSRTQYYWYSSDETIAKVSAYGTVTATALWADSDTYKTVTISAVYKDDTSIVGTIDFTIYKSNDTTTKYLEYGMDVRTGGTISGTEVTSNLGEPISVSNSPEVTMHTQKTRLICLGEDSPTTSIQDFIWTTSDSSIATVSTFGTITAHKVGVVTITGVYKYNSNYKVVIEIEVVV